MTSSPIEVLQKAREELVKARRQTAEVLAQPYGRTTTPEARNPGGDRQHRQSYRGREPLGNDGPLAEIG